MITVSPYQSGIVNFDYKPFEANLDLEMKVLMYKQDQFDKAYAGIQKLRKQALNIHFENEENQKVITNFNNSISKQLAELDTGNFDLSSPSVVNKYTSMFTELTNNAQLVKNYKHDLSVQKTMKEFSAIKNSKDPEKAGWGRANEDNLRRRLNSYRKSKDSDLADASSKVYYRNYLDVETELSNKQKDIIKETLKFETPSQFPGIVNEHIWVGKNPTRVNAAGQQYLYGRGASQMTEEAENSFYKNLDADPNFKNVLHGQYSDHLDTRLEAIDKDISETDASIAKTTDVNRKQALEIRKERLIANRKSISQKSQNLGSAGSIDDATAISWMTELYTDQTNKRFVDTYGGYAKSVTSKISPAADYLMKVADYEHKVKTAKTTAEFKEKEYQAKREDEMFDRNLEIAAFEQEYGVKYDASTGGYKASPGSSLDAPSNVTIMPSASPSDDAAETFVNSVKEGVSRFAEDGNYKLSNPFLGVEGSYRTSKKEEEDINNSIAEKYRQSLNTVFLPKGRRRLQDAVELDDGEVIMFKDYKKKLESVLVNGKFDVKRAREVLNTPLSDVDANVLAELINEYESAFKGLTEEDFLGETKENFNLRKRGNAIADYGLKRDFGIIGDPNAWKNFRQGFVGDNPTLDEFEKLMNKAILAEQVDSWKDLLEKDIVVDPSVPSYPKTGRQYVKYLTELAHERVKNGLSEFSKDYYRANLKLQMLKGMGLNADTPEAALHAALKKNFNFPLFTGIHHDFSDIKGIVNKSERDIANRNHARFTGYVKTVIPAIVSTDIVSASENPHGGVSVVFEDLGEETEKQIVTLAESHQKEAAKSGNTLPQLSILSNADNKLEILFYPEQQAQYMDDVLRFGVGFTLNEVIDMSHYKAAYKRWYKVVPTGANTFNVSFYERVPIMKDDTEIPAGIRDPEAKVHSGKWEDRAIVWKDDNGEDAEIQTFSDVAPGDMFNSLDCWVTKGRGANCNGYGGLDFLK